MKDELKDGGTDLEGLLREGNFWDYITLTPEAMHMVMWQMSDRTIPRSFTTMEGFGVHTFRFVTADGKSTSVKFHWKPRMGLQPVLWDEAVKSNGADLDRHWRDLWDAPKGCPVSNCQHDGHMQTDNRKGRVNYEPNGWGEGPRTHPLEGYVSHKAPVTGEKVRLRPESFADRYS